MPTHLNPYLGFRGEAREAMEFYRSALGGELELNTFGDSGMAGAYPGQDDKIMHSQLKTDNGLVLMAADAPDEMDQPSGSGISVSLSGEDEAELRGYWDKLSDGATITAPFEKAPWGDVFGMCTDRFGVQWMVNVAGTSS